MSHLYSEMLKLSKSTLSKYKFKRKPNLKNPYFVKNSEATENHEIKSISKLLEPASAEDFTNFNYRQNKLLFSEKILKTHSNHENELSISEQLDFEKKGQYIVEVDMGGTGLTYNFKDLFLFEFTKRGSFRFLEKLACLDESEASKVYGLVSLEFEKSVGRSLEKLGNGSFLESSINPGALELIEFLGGFNTLFDLTMKHIHSC